MSTIHRWFRSGSYSLAGHIHLPVRACRDLGVLIVPPFGWEDACSHRSLRFLGETIGANGIPSMRFDLPGTGDSSGNAHDADLVDAWIQSICDAASDLRVATGVQDVAAVGVRLGAMLAVAAASRGADLQDLVLWGPAATGRALLRELRASQQLEQSAAVGAGNVPIQPAPGLEVSGFLIAPETERVLEALDLSALPFQYGRRIMVLTRDDFPPDDKLVRALRTSGCTVEVRTGSGYATMLADPHDAVPPVVTIGEIVHFLTQGPASTTAAPAGLMKQAAEQTAVTVIDNVGTKVLEAMLTIESSRLSIFGALSEPLGAVPPADLCLLFLNAGAVRHIGPNRMWVEAARKWASQGVPSLRMDFGGIGEADGEPSPDVSRLYQGNVVEQIEMVMHMLRSRVGARRFAVVGLCSGAFWAFHAASRLSDVCAAILLNPRLFFWDPEVDRRRMLRRTANGLTDFTDWRRLASGQINAGRIKQAAQAVLHNFHKRGNRPVQIPPVEMASCLESIQRNNGHLVLIFTEDEPLLREMEEESWLPPGRNSCLRCIRVPSGGHTFRPHWAQQIVHRLIDDEIALLLSKDLPIREEHSQMHLAEDLEVGSFE